jgi:hypothetical protein
MKSLEGVISDHKKEIMSIDKVTGIFPGRKNNGEPFVGIMVEKDTPAIRKSLPAKLDGYDVQIEETGEFTIQNSDLSFE